MKSISNSACAFRLRSICQQIIDNDDERQQHVAHNKLQQLARQLRRQQLEKRTVQQSEIVTEKTSKNDNLKPERVGLGMSLGEQLSERQRRRRRENARKRRRQAATKAEQAAQDKPVLNQENVLKKPAAQLLKADKNILNQKIVTEKTNKNDYLKPERVGLVSLDKQLSKGQRKRRRQAATKAEQAAKLLNEDKAVMNRENMSKKPAAQLLKGIKLIQNQEILTKKTNKNDNLKPERVGLGMSLDEQLSERQRKRRLENARKRHCEAARKRRRQAATKAEQAAQLLKEDKPVLNQENTSKKPAAQLLKGIKPIQNQEILTEKTTTNDNLRPERVELGMSLGEQLSKGQRKRRRQAAAKAEQAAQLLKEGKPVLNQEIISTKSATTPVVAKDDVPNSAPKSIQNVIKSDFKKTVAPPTAQVLTKDTESKKSINTIASDMQTVSKIRPRFSLKDSNLGGQIQAIALHFRNEIKLFQQHLITLHCSTITDPCPLIAKIFCSHIKSISTEIFNIVREEIVGWIGIYQHQGMDTPTFHSIKNNGTDVTIVCENHYAYECLEKSVGEIERLKLLPYLISIEKMPPVSHLLYCYGAIYESIIGDPDLLLTQINLHQPVLDANNWIVISHEVCHEKQETHFILLLDAQSSLALTFYYNNKLLICLHQLKFTSRGHVSAAVE